MSGANILNINELAGITRATLQQVQFLLGKWRDSDAPGTPFGTRNGSTARTRSQDGRAADAQRAQRAGVNPDSKPDRSFFSDRSLSWRCPHQHPVPGSSRCAADARVARCVRSHRSAVSIAPVSCCITARRRTVPSRGRLRRAPGLEAAAWRRGRCTQGPAHRYPRSVSEARLIA